MIIGMIDFSFRFSLDLVLVLVIMLFKNTYCTDSNLSHYTIPHVHSSSFHVPGRISISQSKLYSTNTDYKRQNGTVRQMNDPLLLKFMGDGNNLFGVLFRFAV